MNRNVLQNLIEEFVANNNTEKAIKLLLMACKDRSEAKNNAVLLSARLYSLLGDKQKGLVSEETYNLRLNQLNDSLINTVKYLDEEDIDDAEFSPNSNEKIMSEKETPKVAEGFFSQLFAAIPRPLNILVALLLLGITTYGAYRYFLPPIVETQIIEPTKKAFTLVGVLIGETTKKPLSNVSVGIENSTFATDETIQDGIFVIENVALPESKILSLIVTYPDKTTFPIKDIDIAHQFPDANNRIDIGQKYVKDYTAVLIPSQQTTPTKKATQSESKKDAGKTIIIDNKGGKMEGNTIIQAEKVTVTK